MNERIYYSRDAELRARRDRTVLAIIVAAFGLGIGAVITLLLAPRPGEETRRTLGETLDQAANHVVKAVEEVGERIRSN
jgi:gas vesicle protein